MNNFFQELDSLFKKFKKTPNDSVQKKLLQTLKQNSHLISQSSKKQNQQISEIFICLQNYQKSKNYGLTENAEETCSLIQKDTEEEILNRIISLSSQTRQKSVLITTSLKQDTENLLQISQKNAQIKSTLRLTEKSTNKIHQNLQIDKLYLLSIIFLFALIDFIALYQKLKLSQLIKLKTIFFQLINQQWETNVSAKKQYPKKSILKIWQFKKTMEDLVRIRNQSYRKSIQLSFLKSEIKNIENCKSSNSRLIHYLDGSSYEGQVLENKRHGRGKLIVPNVFVYEGDFRMDKMEGQGELILTDGTRYKGGFKNDLQHGQGTETFPDGSKYSGEYLDGEKHGKGEYTWPSGSTYKGQLAKGELQGFGIYKSSRNSLYEGEWSKNQKNGHGQKKSQNGQIYIGEFRFDEKYGKGILLSKNQKFEGLFKNDKPHGKGVLIQSDGTVVQGEWHEGNLIKQQLIFNTSRAKAK